ncbi:transcriptional regulator [Cohnella sp. AR92]|uniref:ArsR/SmtB family transcription factor n=1 Tax=Cohnella sp. AR92 TaxID=648716 RepID=UPI000F8E4229|nr:metalloregulator ArsR/SmtB family transcription factor [Cohnella sp. AR92]RUS48934.1 ArsR family transcriptional regulator [Cohnella sp. AR92]
MTIKQSTVDDDKRARVFKALAEKKRIEIVRYLQAEPDRNNCGEIARAMGMDKSNVTYHLKIMYDADLIKYVREGQNKKIYLLEEQIQAVLPGFLESL